MIVGGSHTSSKALHHVVLLLSFLIPSIVSAFHTTETIRTTNQHQRHYPPIHHHLHYRASRLFAKSNDNNNKNKYLTAAERERRSENRRRKERKNDVVIGKTSAKSEAVDYALNPKATEQEWMRQASDIEQKVYQLTQQGMECLKMLQLEDSNKLFDEVFKLRPNAYLWQAGITKFYLGDITGACNIFSKNAKVFESKFGGPASEERIWTDACVLKSFYTDMTKKERKQFKLDNGGKIYSSQTSAILRPVEEDENNQQDDEDDWLNAMSTVETRRDIRIIRDLFHSSVDNDVAGVIMSRAKLRSLGGRPDDETNRFMMMDRKMWKIHSWYYLGLHYDTMGQYEESCECMKMALQLCPSTGKSDNIIHTLPFLHMAQRDWFDDEEVIVSSSPRKRSKSRNGLLDDDDDDDDDDEISKRTTKSRKSFEEASNEMRKSEHATDPIILDSIQESIANMRFKELQNALRLRCLSSVGAKDELQVRLFQSLMEDSGFRSF